MGEPRLQVCSQRQPAPRTAVTRPSLSHPDPAGPRILSALQKVLDLSWASTTRLLIHFGDAPCHGNRYHDGGCINGSFDSYPGGNPDGGREVPCSALSLTTEPAPALLRWLIN